MTADSREILGWPFLVGRGRRVGYRVIAAPPFMITSGIESMLQSREVDPAQSTASHHVAVVASPVGQLTVVSTLESMTTAKVVVPTEADHGDRPLLDDHSRPLEIHYGFVIRGNVRGAVDERDVSQSRPSAIESYRRFLQDENDSSVAPTSPFAPFSSVAAAKQPKPRERPDRRERREAEPHRSGPSTRRGLVAASVACLGLAVFLAMQTLTGSNDSGASDLEYMDTCGTLTIDRLSCEIIVRSNADDPTTLAVEPSDGFIELEDQCGAALQPAQTCLIRVIIDPIGSGQLSAVTITSTRPRDEIVVPLQIPEQR